jgi:hypothetical protein
VARYLFQLTAVTPAGSYVRLDSASGSTSPTAVSPTDSAYVFPGAVLRSDASTGALPTVAAGVATLYQKTLNASGGVTATATLMGTLVDGAGPGALEALTFPIPVNTDPTGLSASATSLASNSALTGTFTRAPGVVTALAGALATLRRGYRSTCIGVIGDSTGDGKLVGAGTNVDEWPQVFVKRLAADYPGYTLLERRWNDTNQGYDMPITWQTGTTNGSADRHALFTASTPGALQYSGTAVTGDLDVRARIAPTTWTPSGGSTIAAKWESTGNQRSWLFLLNAAGTLGLNWSTAGTAGAGQQNSTANIPATANPGNGNPLWVRFTLTVATGAISFYYSADGAAWTQLGTTVTTSATSLFGGTAPYQIGSFGSTFTTPFDGKVHWVQVHSGIQTAPAGGQSLVPPIPDDWDYYSGETTVTLGGAPVLMLLNGSQSSQNVAYFDNSTRRPILCQPHGQAVWLLSTSHNDGTQSKALWLSAYATWIGHVQGLTPYVPIVLVGQNPVGLGGSFSLTQQGIELRGTRSAMVQQLAAALAGVYAFDAWPLLTAAETVDQLHPTSGAGSGSEKWGLGVYSRAIKQS